MEMIHPPGGYFQRKERGKSPFVGGDVWLGQGAFGQFGLPGLSSYAVLIDVSWHVFGGHLLSRPVAA